MLAVTLDLVMVAAAMATAFGVWFARRNFDPVSIWEKLMVGSAMLAFSLFIRFSDAVWAEIPWSLISDPMARQIVVVIGLIGGVLAVAAGLAEWIPLLMTREIIARWRESWSRCHQYMVSDLADAKDVDRATIILRHLFCQLCETDEVYYQTYRQRTGTFVCKYPEEIIQSADMHQSLERVSHTRRPLVVRTPTGWMLTIPVVMDQRIYGALTVMRETDHSCFHESALLLQSAQRAAITIHGLVRETLNARLTLILSAGAEMERLLGATDDPIEDLMNMFEVMHRVMDVDYVAALAYEGEGRYARRYSRVWDQQGFIERGLHVAIGHAATPRIPTSDSAMVMHAGKERLSAAAIPHANLPHSITVPLYRGTEAIGLLVVASRENTLRLDATDMMRRWSATYSTAIERIASDAVTTQLSRRLKSLGKLATNQIEAPENQNLLTTRMLDDIPGTFCQYMQITPDEQQVTIGYRRTRRTGWGHETTGLTLNLSDLPTCRMVIESARSVLFRQDDPELHFSTDEAETLFGVEPNSLLVIPIIRGDRCEALLAIGELRDTHRHAFTTEDRRFADSLVSLHGVRNRIAEPSISSQLAAAGDLNLTFSSPLTGIMGSVEILRQVGDKSPGQQKYLDLIERNAIRIKNSVSDLADLTHEGDPIGTF